jgi:sodium-dependent dicarboxylate transporter 2/3/5
MILTAFLSFWISNTASAAVMIPIVLYILSKNKLNIKKSPFAKAFILGVAYAATAGGIGTLVGSPPNPLAAKYLSEMGTNFGFMNWLQFGLPFVAIFLVVIWFVVLFMYPPEIKKIKMHKKKTAFTMEEKMVGGIFLITIVLWATDTITGLSASVVALVPLFLLYFTRLVNEEDFKKINWPILSLIGSGLVLGSAFQAVGIDLFIASLVGDFAVGQPLFLIMFALSIVGVLVTMFASNTASAALMIPLSIPLAPILGISPEILIVVTAIAASIDFTAPMGTPPNAIAYSTGALTVPQMAKTGIVLSLIASLLLAGFATFIW